MNMERREEHVETYWKDEQRVALVDEKDQWYRLTKMTKEDRKELFDQKAPELKDKEN